MIIPISQVAEELATLFHRGDDAAAAPVAARLEDRPVNTHPVARISSVRFLGLAPDPLLPRILPF
jgi:hypothetical protein